MTDMSSLPVVKLKVKASRRQASNRLGCDAEGGNGPQGED